MVVAVGLDPGYERSAIVLLQGMSVLNHCLIANEDALELLGNLRHQRNHELVIERVASFGMPVGEEIFETVYWTGRFAQQWGRPVHRIKRHEVKAHLCKHPRANDTHIRQVLLDTFGPGKEKAIGTKAHPGPLYGIHADEWAALAVAVTWRDRQSNEVLQ